MAIDPWDAALARLVLNPDLPAHLLDVIPQVGDMVQGEDGRLFRIVRIDYETREVFVEPAKSDQP